jgi:hypothetical protein
MYIHSHVNYPLFLSDFNETRILTDFKKIIKYQIHENPSSGSRVVPCGQRDRWTDMMKLTVAFCNFANAPKKEICLYPCHGGI